MAENHQYSILLKETTLYVRLSQELERQRHGWNVERHSNAEMEFHYLLAGTCQVDIDDRHYRLEGPTLLMIAPGQYHNATTKDSRFLALPLTLVIPDKALRDTLSNRIRQRPILDISPEWGTLCDRIFQEYRCRDMFRDVMLQAFLTQLIVATFRSMSLFPESTRSEESLQYAIRTDKIDGYFGHNFSNSWDEDTLAEILHLSKRQLARILLNHYGMTFRQKKLAARMDHARYLLQMTNMHIYEIAAATGYHSEAAFYKAFRNQYGLTPQDYRRQFPESSAIQPEHPANTGAFGESDEKSL